MFIMNSVTMAEEALKARIENLKNIKNAKCISLRTYRDIIKEIDLLEKFISNKKKDKKTI